MRARERNASGDHGSLDRLFRGLLRQVPDRRRCSSEKPIKASAADISPHAKRSHTAGDWGSKDSSAMAIHLVFNGSRGSPPCRQAPSIRRDDIHGYGNVRQCCAHGNRLSPRIFHPIHLHQKVKVGIWPIVASGPRTKDPYGPRMETIPQATQYFRQPTVSFNNGWGRQPGHHFLSDRPGSGARSFHKGMI